jgi:hypothetical protein
MRTALIVIAAAVVASPSRPALAQDASAAPGAPPPPARVRIVLNGALWLGSGPTFSDTRSFEEYAEQTTIGTRYQTNGRFGPDAAAQVSVFRELGILVGYSSLSRDTTGTVDVSRPHPLYLDRPRSASAELSGYGYSERAFHLDLAYGRGAGHLDWSLFAGVSLFRVEADLLDSPTYTDVYPYDELTIGSTPGKKVKSSPTGFNVGGRLDYRVGGSGHFGLGVQLLYSTASVELQATPEAQRATFHAGGLQTSAGVRLFF